jgi:DNA polymerase III delta prime subunit
VNDILDYLNIINKQEMMNITKKTINNIINFYDSDIRSMINFMQSNINNKIYILDNNVYIKLYNSNITESLQVFNTILNTTELKYKLNKRLIIKNYISYILNNKLDILSYELIKEIEYIIHNLENEDLFISYVYHCLKSS